QLNIPIFDSFAKKAKTERARIQMLNALEQKNMFERSVDLEVTNARQSYNAASERLEMQRKNVALAEKIYNTTKTKYQHGLGSSLEITQAEQSLYSVQQNFNQALYDVIVAKINLDKAFGK
ncbi:MAG TPA: TolC family protein, partial [Saprospiraceae bacterium]|nr:TolC family protein [Saprospiraceae bacterium]